MAEDQVIQLPDGQVVSFPSSMSDDDISKVLKQMKFAPEKTNPDALDLGTATGIQANPQTTKIPGLDKTSSDVVRGVQGAVSGVTKLPASILQAARHPLDTLQGMVSAPVETMTGGASEMLKPERYGGTGEYARGIGTLLPAVAGVALGSKAPGVRLAEIPSAEIAGVKIPLNQAQAGVGSRAGRMMSRVAAQSEDAAPFLDVSKDAIAAAAEAVADQVSSVPDASAWTRGTVAQKAIQTAKQMLHDSGSQIYDWLDKVTTPQSVPGMKTVESDPAFTIPPKQPLGFSPQNSEPAIFGPTRSTQVPTITQRGGVQISLTPVKDAAKLLAKKLNEQLAVTGGKSPDPQVNQMLAQLEGVASAPDTASFRAVADARSALSEMAKRLGAFDSTDLTGVGGMVAAKLKRGVDYAMRKGLQDSGNPQLLPALDKANEIWTTLHNDFEGTALQAMLKKAPEKAHSIMLGMSHDDLARAVKYIPETVRRELGAQALSDLIESATKGTPEAEMQGGQLGVVSSHEALNTQKLYNKLHSSKYANLKQMLPAGAYEDLDKLAALANKLGVSDEKLLAPLLGGGVGAGVGAGVGYAAGGPMAATAGGAIGATAGVATIKAFARWLTYNKNAPNLMRRYVEANAVGNTAAATAISPAVTAGIQAAQKQIQDEERQRQALSTAVSQ